MTSSDASSPGGSPQLEKILAAESRSVFGRWRFWLGLLVLLAAGAAAILSRDTSSKPAQPSFKTEPAAVGTLVVKVSATGNLQPTNQVQVGSELSGIVTEVLVDDNDRVTKGQVLARLDLSRLKDSVAKSRASLAAAEAQVQLAAATVAESRAELARFRQVSEASGGKVPSRHEMDAADASVKRADANQAAANASVVQARANLQSDQTNLEKASIRSPIDGLVLTRAVEPGQTVAASLQAPVLFTIAEDLARMELQVDIDEADVGQVAVGQKASFSVDAWPGRKYAAVITRVGYGSEVKDGVVSYPAVLEVGNADLSLRPGMTGTADIVTLTHENALLVPAAALRFNPTAASEQQAQSGGIISKLWPRPPRTPPKVKPASSEGPERVWVVRGGRPVPIEVQVGASNGQRSEILGGKLQAGTQLITEMSSPTP